jgi:hypothetical protein
MMHFAILVNSGINPMPVLSGALSCLIRTFSKCGGIRFEIMGIWEPENKILSYTSKEE